MTFNSESAYNQAILFAKAHYENFPVVSFLVPKSLRKHVAIIYWFARTADDMADEEELTAEERLNKLNEFEANFNNLMKSSCKSDFEFVLYHTIKGKGLNPDYFINLLKAFKQDVVKKHYQNYDEVINYCTNSANPVGRLILELYDIKVESAGFYSDKICTALQLTNFLQDIGRDFEKGRIYLPEDEMQSYGVSRIMFEEKKINLNFKQLIEFNVNRIQNLFDEGKILLNFLSGRLRLEIKWTILGGETVLEKIRENSYNVFIRPSLNKTDFVKLLMKTLN